MRPGGSVYFSTLNRTPKAWLFAIVGAEHIQDVGIDEGIPAAAAFVEVGIADSHRFAQGRCQVQKCFIFGAEGLL